MSKSRRETYEKGRWSIYSCTTILNVTLSTPNLRVETVNILTFVHRIRHPQKLRDKYYTPIILDQT